MNRAGAREEQGRWLAPSATNPLPRHATTGLAGSVPGVWKGGVALFALYARRHLRRHFHGVRVLRDSLRQDVGHRPLLIYSNHASWWDPLVALTVQRALFPRRTLYGPMDAAALKRYRFLGRLGLFGVEARSPSGARRFLRTGAAILATPEAVLWVTPQGRFADARERPPQFRPGLSRLIASCPGATVLPVAMEYTFWGERLPEVLIAFGEPLDVGVGGARGLGDPSDLTWMSEESLARAQDTLARAGMGGDAGPFETLLEGKVGVGGVYDLWRRCRSWFRGESFNPAHGS